MRDVSGEILNELDYLPRISGASDHKIGVIGAGRIAQRRQIPAYLYAGLDVAAAADIDPAALDQVQSRYGIERLYSDYRDLLEQEDIDIIDICTNTFPRKEITLKALQAGKHVLSEKPFARTVNDAKEIIATADAHGVQLAIHQPTRWYYPCVVTRALIDKGFLGDVFYIELRLHGDQDTAYYNDSVTRWHADLEDHVFVEWGAHYFDLVRWFASGETPDEVFAHGTDKGNENFKSKMAVAATAKFKSGTCASFSLNQATRFPGLPMGGMTFRIEGTEGTVAGDMVSNLSFSSRREDGVHATFDWTARLPRDEDPYDYMWTASIRNGHTWPMVELINSIDENRDAICSGRDNLETVKTYLAAMRSDMENRPVKLVEMDDFT